MTNHIDAVARKKQQLTWLYRQLSSGEHLGAGLTLFVAVGPAEATSEGLEIATCSNTDKLLQLLIDSVEADIDLREQLMRAELKNLKTYFGEPT